MSEFKYACPVCGQHIKCDSSQTGTTMTCPTCFQTIIVPQAPADEGQKLILTGTKVGERPLVKNPELNPYANTQQKGISGPVIVGLILLMIGSAVGFVYHGTILQPLFNPKATSPAPGTNHSTSAAKSQSHLPVTVDSNWLTNLAGIIIPDTIAAGRIHGQDFITENAIFSGGTLSLRQVNQGSVASGITINFGGAQPKVLAGKKLNILADTNVSALVTLYWLEDTNPQSQSFNINYALRLEFGELTNSHLPGRIYLCTPDEQKSYVIGTFRANVYDPKGQ